MLARLWGTFITPIVSFVVLVVSFDLLIQINKLLIFKNFEQYNVMTACCVYKLDNSFVLVVHFFIKLCTLFMIFHLRGCFIQCTKTEFGYPDRVFHKNHVLWQCLKCRN